MEWIQELWSPILILLAAFVIGWGAETAQTFIPRALALSLLAWLQTLPEFAVEAAIAWNQQRDLMIANLTGSLRLIVGLGWPMIFFVHFFFHGIRQKKMATTISLEKDDALGVMFLFFSILYFVVILLKGTLTVFDSGILILIYFLYLFAAFKFSSTHEEDPEDLPWLGKKIVRLNPAPKYIATTLVFVLGGAALYFSVHPFLHTLERWALAAGISTFFFVQWVAPFLSEFPEKVSAFNWARQPEKAPMAMMNMVNSNINQWTMLAAMIPIVFNLSLGYLEPVTFDDLHRTELVLTVAQSLLGGILLIDMKFSIYDAAAIFILWIVQFLVGSLREEIAVFYLAWFAIEVLKAVRTYSQDGTLPPAWVAFRRLKAS